jgi:hypothetical protein
MLFITATFHVTKRRYEMEMIAQSVPIDIREIRGEERIWAAPKELPLCGFGLGEARHDRAFHAECLAVHGETFEFVSVRRTLSRRLPSEEIHFVATAVVPQPDVLPENAAGRIP